MIAIPLESFTNDMTFPFFIQFGTHDEKMMMHSHADFSELVIILDGTATHIVENERYQISKGDVFVISNDTVHGYESAENFHICNIMFRLENVFPKNYDIWNLPGFHALFVIEPYITRDHSFQSRLKLSMLQLEHLKEQLTAMLEEYSKQTEGRKTYLLTSFLMIALELSRQYEMKPDSDQQQYVHLANAVSYIEKNYAEYITIDLLAKQAHLSSRQFSRLFREVYHDSPGNYLLHFRIQKAKVLLCNCELTIAEIAYQCGFNDSNYFSRQFLSATGVTPRTFRKQNS
jgi:AraC family transcriptional regulator, L-rhamnose operon regulatory protein RhaS